MNKKKVVLPPKPVSKKPAALPPSQPPVRDPTNLRGVKAIEYTIKLNDGTYLQAVGELADLMFRYLSECETRCAEKQLVNYLAPSFTRYDIDGRVIAKAV
jgi:hypothetical protein